MRVYTDGGCRKTVGGWAWYNEDTLEYESGVEVPSTNQRMELLAALDALDHHLDDEELCIVSDSQYLVNCFKNRWFERWERNGWRNNKGFPIENQDLWRALIGLYKAHGSVEFEWVRGHAGIFGNEKADQLCTSVILLAMGDC